MKKKSNIDKSIDKIVKYQKSLRSIKGFFDGELGDSQVILRHLNRIKRSGSGVSVTDHAVVRFLEREKKFDIEAVRSEILELVKSGRLEFLEEYTEQYIDIANNSSALIIKDGEAETVVTVIERDWSKSISAKDIRKNIKQ